MNKCDNCPAIMDENDLKHSKTTCFKCQFKAIGCKFGVTNMVFSSEY